jgi:hypothetical protein
MGEHAGDRMKIRSIKSSTWWLLNNAVLRILKILKNILYRAAKKACTEMTDKEICDIVLAADFLVSKK